MITPENIELLRKVLDAADEIEFKEILTMVDAQRVLRSVKDVNVPQHWHSTVHMTETISTVSVCVAAESIEACVELLTIPFVYKGGLELLLAMLNSHATPVVGVK